MRAKSGPDERYSKEFRMIGSRIRIARYSLLSILAAFLAFSMLVVLPAHSAIVSPAQHFGFEPGSDRMLFDYEGLTGYLELLSEASPMVRMDRIGFSPEGRPIFIVFISSAENISSLDELREINRRLALDPDIEETERESMIEKGRVFFLATLSMHSSEVGPSQSAPLIAYDLVTTSDPLKLKWLSDVVYMMVPSHNPDGMDMVVDNYLKYKGTRYEGARLPRVYHKYVGHDNNRDFVILSQKDTKAIAAIYNLDWFPQVMVEKHQMGSGSVRFFVPPNHDPIAENVEAGIWNWAGIFGSNMIKDMTSKGQSGVAQHYLFDDYWPGSTETCIWKNVIGFLTEAASVQDATPIFIEENELGAYGKGLSEYKKSTNMPLPWPGGWWRLGDIVAYEITSTMSIIKTASVNRDEILRFRNDICRREVERGRSQAPYYYILPSSEKKQHDRGELAVLVNLLIEHGIKVYRSGGNGVTGEGLIYEKGDVVIPLAQPFRPFIKEVMEKQTFPLRHYTPGGKIIRPYDITSWSLPLHMGLACHEVSTREPQLESMLQGIEAGEETEPALPDGAVAAIFPANNNESYLAAFMALGAGLKVFRAEKKGVGHEVSFSQGDFLIAVDEGILDILGMLTVAPGFISDSGIVSKIVGNFTESKMPKIAIVETFTHDMDAGWTRFVFDSYHIPFEAVHPAEFEKKGLLKKFDILVFPDTDKSLLMTGKYESGGRYSSGGYPPEYVKGMGKKGKEKLMGFIDGGGIIISWGRSTALFSGEQVIVHGEDDEEEFTLPFRDISEEATKDGLYCPGSLVRVLLTTGHPLTAGMQDQAGVFFRGRNFFSTSVPRFDMDRRVIAKFPEDDMLLSGYAEKIEKAGNRTAMVWLRKGKGQLVLFSFNPQFRASTSGCYKLLFNSLFLQPPE